MKKNTAIPKIFTFRNLIYFISLIAAWPCVFSVMGFLPDFKLTYSILLPVIAIYAISHNCFKIPTPIFRIILIQCILWIVYLIIHHDQSYITRLIVSVTTYLLLAIQYKYNHFEFLKLFYKWQLVQVILGAIGFLLVITNILHPLFIFREANGLDGAFFGFFTTNVFYPVVRNAGFYDEPGALANWGMMALLINKLFFKNRRTEITLIIGLITTLSLAYFVQLFVYLILFNSEQRKKIIILGVVVFALIKGLSMYNEDYYDALFGRMEYDEEIGSVKGDNRIVQLEEANRIFQKSPYIGVGAGNFADYVRDKEDVSSNIVSSLAQDGIFGFVILYLPLFLLYKLGFKKREFLFTAIILTMGYYQRPYGAVFLINSITLFSLVMYAYIDSKNKSITIS